MTHSTYLVTAVGIWGDLGCVHNAELEGALGEDTPIIPGEETRPHAGIERIQSKHKHLTNKETKKDMRGYAVLHTNTHVQAHYIAVKESSRGMVTPLIFWCSALAVNGKENCIDNILAQLGHHSTSALAPAITPCHTSHAMLWPDLQPQEYALLTMFREIPPTYPRPITITTSQLQPLKTISHLCR